MLIEIKLQTTANGTSTAVPFLDNSGFGLLLLFCFCLLLLFCLFLGLLYRLLLPLLPLDPLLLLVLRSGVVPEELADDVSHDLPRKEFLGEGVRLLDDCLGLILMFFQILDCVDQVGEAVLDRIVVLVWLEGVSKPLHLL